MKISVVVSVYNMGKYLPKAMQSLLDQTFADYEILIVDDGSTDGSAVECDRQAEGRENIRVFHKENGGLSSARNYGIEHAMGEYIIFPDPDDWVEPDYLQTLYSLILENPETDLAVCGHYETKNGQDMLWDPEAHKVMLNTDEALFLLMRQDHYCGYAWNKLYRMDLIREHALRFDEELGMVQDLHFAVRYILYCRLIAYDPIPLYHYCRDNGGVTRSRKIGKRELSGLRTYEKIADEMHETHPAVVADACASLCEMVLRYIGVYYRYDLKEPEKLALLRGKFRQHCRHFFASRRFGIRHKCAAAFVIFSPRMYYFLVHTFGHMREPQMKGDITREQLKTVVDGERTDDQMD